MPNMRQAIIWTNDALVTSFNGAYLHHSATIS